MLAQQADVMDGIQRLRAKADANNKLQSTPQQKVSKRSEGSKQVIVIEPTNPETMYVPYYDPAVVYGAWPYPSYPPYYWGASYWPYGGAVLGAGLAFGAGYALGRWTGGGYWGGNVNWNNNNINISRPGGGGGNWNHRPEHRQGVRYNNKGVADRMGRGNRTAPVQVTARTSGGATALAATVPVAAPVIVRAAAIVPVAAPAIVPAAVKKRPSVRAAVKRVRVAVPAAVKKRRSGPAAARVRAVAAAVETPSRAAAAVAAAPWPRRHAVTRAWAGVEAVAAARAWAAAVVAAVAAEVAVAVVVAADAARTSRSSTRSSCSGISTTGSASIASATMAATKPMSA